MTYNVLSGMLNSTLLLLPSFSSIFTLLNSVSNDKFRRYSFRCIYFVNIWFTVSFNVCDFLCMFSIILLRSVDISEHVVNTDM